MIEPHMKYELIYSPISLTYQHEPQTHISLLSLTNCINHFAVTRGIKYAIHYPLREESADTEGHTRVSALINTCGLLCVFSLKN